jgi:hypothetical protein
LKYRPTSISVAGVDFQIKYCKISEYGLYELEDKVIKIRNTLTDEQVFDTLMHECVHAAFDMSGITYMIDDDQKEEAIVRSLENLLFPVYQQEYEKFRTTKSSAESSPKKKKS